MKNKKNGLGRRFWMAMTLFGLIGQVAWVVENMYLNVFIYKMFHASAADISMMVGASAVMATLTTIVIGALSDRVGKRKIFICGGYLVWGITILGFAFVRMDVLTPLCESVAEAAALGVSLTITLDCLMTFFGSAANDAAFNAWLTESGDETNRGKIEGINAMMPLVAILVVFGGFMGFNLDKAESWTTIYLIIGGIVLLVGILGIFLIEERKTVQKEEKTSYFSLLIYGFRLSTLKANKLLYAVIAAFAVFGISIQIFMPYLILYYEKTLGMSNYVIVMAPAIVLAAVVTACYGRLYDRLGFAMSIVPCVVVLIGGYVILYFSVQTLPVFLGSLCMMSGYLGGMAVFGAKIREHTPRNMVGHFQGLRILGQVLIPGVVGPAVGAFVLRNAPQIENADGTFSFLPDKIIWVAATAAALLLSVALWLIFVMVRKGHYELCSEAGEKNDSETWNSYPRPQLKRDSWRLLKENWTLNGHPLTMPFPPQSVLAGYPHRAGSRLLYETAFLIPDSFTKERILLHFGAADQTAEVLVNGRTVGTHEGGYLAFTFDITEYIKRDAENKLTVKVTDKLNRIYPYGKQCKKRGGMWYTPVSGIWQNVWLEQVPAEHIENVVLTPDLEGVDIQVVTSVSSGGGFKAFVTLENGEVIEQNFDGMEGRITLAGHLLSDGTAYTPKLWNTEEPHLYTMRIITEQDEVETYFALRTVEIKKMDGVNRVCLNGKPVFLHGVLDQGYFCDGIFLPAEEKEYERDILRMKELGFNMLRKHIKIEPDCFYYYCDKHGMLVMQDMVNNGGYSFLRDTALPTIGRKERKDNSGLDAKRKQIFMEHTKQTIEQLYNHPCIVAYTIFNEGWGQFESDAMYEFVKKQDGTRLIDSTSGWFWQEKSDFDSEHIYFKTIDLNVKERPLLVSECGGYSRVIDGHYYSRYNTYGYGSAESEAELTKRITDMYRTMILPGIKKGVCGCIYTQLSDVEDEVNGLYTYDRKVCKVEKEAMREIAEEIQSEIKR